MQLSAVISVKVTYKPHQYNVKAKWRFHRTWELNLVLRNFRF